MDAKLYVGNMSYNTTEDELKALFSEVGTVTDLVIIIDKPTGRSKGFGFVTMSTQEEADKAISQLNGKMVGGRELKINKARPREDSGGSRGGGGGYRGGGNRGGGGGGYNRGGNRDGNRGGNRGGNSRY